MSILKNTFYKITKSVAIRNKTYKKYIVQFKVGDRVWFDRIGAKNVSMNIHITDENNARHEYSSVTITPEALEHLRVEGGLERTINPDFE